MLGWWLDLWSLVFGNYSSHEEASGDFSYLAKAAGMTKKDYLSQLAGWMLNQDAGKKAAQAFAASLPVKRDLLTKLDC